MYYAYFRQVLIKFQIGYTPNDSEAALVLLLSYSLYNYMSTNPVGVLFCVLTNFALFTVWFT